jgi:hypothetical protein
MKFTTEKEVDNNINFLEITILKEHDKLAFSIYRKPTTTDSIIPNDSCHPQEHKLAAIIYLTNRMNMYSLNAANKEKESNKIKHILHNNKCDLSLLNKPTKTDSKKETTCIQMGKVYLHRKRDQIYFKTFQRFLCQYHNHHKKYYQHTAFH